MFLSRCLKPAFLLVSGVGFNPAYVNYDKKTGLRRCDGFCLNPGILFRSVS